MNDETVEVSRETLLIVLDAAIGYADEYGTPWLDRAIAELEKEIGQS